MDRERLRRARTLLAHRGLSVAALARRVEISPGHARDILLGRRDPSAQLTERMTRELGAEGMAYIWLGEGAALPDVPPPPPSPAGTAAAPAGDEK